MSKTYRYEKKGHDDYLMNSNKVIKSEITEQETKKLKTRKLSLSYNLAAKEKQRSTLKFNSLSKGSQKSRLKEGRKQKIMINYDEHAIKTTRTDEENLKKKEKQSIEQRISVIKSKTSENRKKQQKKNRSKIKLDSFRNKKPLKLSQSGRFHYEDIETQTQRLKNCTQITSNQNDNQEDKQTKAYCRSCSNTPKEFNQIYSHCTSILETYRKKLNEISKENSKLKNQNRKLKQTQQR